MKGSDFPQGDEKHFFFWCYEFCTRMSCFTELSRSFKHNPDPMMRSHTKLRMTVDPVEMLISKNHSTCCVRQLRDSGTNK